MKINIFKALIKDGDLLKKITILYKYFRRNLKSIFRHRLSYFIFGKFTLIFLMYIILFWIYSEMEIYVKEFVVCHFNDKLIVISEFIEKYDSINTFLFLLICAAFYVFILKIKDNLHYSISHLFIGIFLLYFFLFDNFWIYNNLPFVNIGYNYLLSIFIIVVLFIDLFKKIIYSCNKIILINSHKGNINFSNDQITDPGEKSVRKNFARSIAMQLINTDITKVSFSLAVTGEWGSGKSTFLKCIIDELIKDDRVYIMQFNPWNSISSQSLVQDFFKQLNEFVSKKYSPLGKSLISYANALKELDIEPTINRFLRIISMSDNQSINKLKRNVEIGLSHIYKPVVIIIDDIDRLEKDELFEILRLVRNTGNFINLLYIVAYDEKYVVEQLNCKGIYNGRLFLEKIFPAQVSLPKVDLTEVYDTFKNEIRSMVKQRGWINSCIDTLKVEEVDLIKSSLYSFRRAKHFARRFSMSAIFLYNNLGPDYFSLHDLLLMELLHYLSPSLYDILTNDPKRYLLFENKNSDRYYYIFNKDKESDVEAFLVNENNKNKDQIVKILKLLFASDGFAAPNGSIRWTDKYVNYMCLGRPKNKVSDLEFITMINSQVDQYKPEDSMCLIIKSWCLSKHRRKDIRSIYDQFAKFRIDRNSCDMSARYINALFYWLRYECDVDNGMLYSMVCKGIMKSKYNQNLYKFLIHNIERNIEILISSRNFEKVAKLCSYLYDYSRQKECLLDIFKIDKMLVDNMEYLLGVNSWNAVSLVENDGNLLNKVFVMSSRSFFTDSGNLEYVNPVVDCAINWFSKRTKLSRSIQKVNLIFEEDRRYNNNKYLKQIFGSDNPERKLDDFKIRCFVSSDSIN